MPATSDTREAEKRERKAKFLEALDRTKSIYQAVDAIGAARPTVYRWRNADPAFAEAWDEALAIKLPDVAALEACAMRRAMDGHLEPIYTSKGELVGHKRKYETSLTIFMLKAWGGKKYQFGEEATKASAEELAKSVREAVAAMGATVPEADE